MGNLSIIRCICVKNTFDKTDLDVSLKRNNFPISTMDIKIEKSEIEEEKEKDPISKPLNQIISKESLYEQELRKHAISSYNFKKSNGDYDHFYNINIKSCLPTNAVKVARLNNEMKILSRNLPIELTNAIFLVQDESRLDIMKAAIIGAEDTPYANGVFIFDIYCDDTFPTNPPKVNLMTTGKSKIRFNPNLYTSGYVCLSLLGTWSGDNIEKWNTNSNILQILMSIQAIVMSDGVIYNEPGHQADNKTPNGIARNIGYSNIVKISNIRYAMIDMIKNPPECFKEIINLHFYYKKDRILKNCKKWIEEEKKAKPEYDGLVEIHNREIAQQYKTLGKKFIDDLNEEIQELTNILENLQLNQEK